MAVWILSPDWCSHKMKSLHCGQTLRWSCCVFGCVRWLCS